MSARGPGNVWGLLGVARIGADGVLVRLDGELVRLLALGSVNALAAAEEECERVCEAMQRVAGRLAAGQSLQLYGSARTLDVRGIAGGERQLCAAAAAAAIAAGRGELAHAIRRLGVAAEESLRAQAEATSALSVRWALACPWRPEWVRGGRRRAGDNARCRPGAALLHHVEGIAGELESCGIAARPMDGGEVLDLLRERLSPGFGGLPASFTRAHALGGIEAGEGSAERAGASTAAVCRPPVDFSDRSRVRIGGCLEQVQHVSLPPEQTWVGWLLHAMQCPAPWTLSVHVTATDRLRERLAQRRRYKRLWGRQPGSRMARAAARRRCGRA
jgi:hypothetical protein